MDWVSGSYVTNPRNRIGQYGDGCGESEFWTKEKPRRTHLRGLDLLVGRKESVRDGALQLRVIC